MKRLLCLTFLVASLCRATPALRAADAPATPAPPKDANAIKQTPGIQKLRYATKIDGKTVKMAYVLSVPVGYDASAAPCPTIIFLHGGGECGDDWNGVLAHGPAMEIQQHPKSAFEATFPFIVICPQCPPRGERWDQPVMMKAVVALLDDLSPKVRIDPDRVYLTGLSMGGKGTWFVAMTAPQKFAAIAPTAADTVDERAPRLLKNIPVWAFAGGADGGAADGSRKMVQMINAAGGRARLTITPGVGHDIWPSVYENTAVYRWFLQHTRNATPTPDAWPRSPGFHPRMLESEVKDNDGKTLLPWQLPYTLYLPANYAPLKQGGYPVLLCLRGAGKTQADDVATDARGISLHGPAGALLKKGNQRFRANFPFVVLAPELPPSHQWAQPETEQAVLSLLDDAAKNLNLDLSRVYVTGDSAAAGGLGLVARAPDRFAAVVPVLAEGGFATPANLAAAMAKLPVWAFAADADAAKAKEVVAASKAGDSKLSPLTPAADVYANAELYDWLLKHTRVKGK